MGEQEKEKEEGAQKNKGKRSGGYEGKGLGREWKGK